MTGGPPSRRAGASQRSRSQYVSIKYTERLVDAGIEPSVAAWATATTMLWPRPSTVSTSRGHPSARAVRRSRLSSSRRWNGSNWFNNRRLLEPIGYIPPAEAEERYYATLDQPAMAA